MFVLVFDRTPGNKPGSSPRGQTPDEAGRRHDANSSVSDLANSVTSDMLMVNHHIMNALLRVTYLTAASFTHLMSVSFLHCLLI